MITNTPTTAAAAQARRRRCRASSARRNASACRCRRCSSRAAFDIEHPPREFRSPTVLMEREFSSPEWRIKASSQRTSRNSSGECGEESLRGQGRGEGAGRHGPLDLRGERGRRPGGPAARRAACRAPSPRSSRPAGRCGVRRARRRRRARRGAGRAGPTPRPGRCPRGPLQVSTGGASRVGAVQQPQRAGQLAGGRAGASVCVRAVGLVDRDHVGQLEDALLDALQLVAGAGQREQQEASRPCRRRRSRTGRRRRSRRARRRSRPPRRRRSPRGWPWRRRRACRRSATAG